MSNKIFTDAEMLRRVWDRESILNLMARRAYYNANDERGKELDELWVSQPEMCANASYGKTWGYYVGIEAIRAYYVGSHDKRRREELDALCAKYPGIENNSENLGCGAMQIHPLSTPLIHIAGDGKTAKGLFYSIGQETKVGSDGCARALWIAMKIGADFVRELGGWKLWHVVEIYDVVNKDGTDYKETPYIFAPGEHPMEAEFGEPTIKMLTHDERFNWLDNYPPEPMPYETFNVSISYGPEGHPDFKRQEGVR